MQMQGKAQRISIYIGENDHYHGQPLYMAILEMLKREGASGATVTRGLAGFGAHSRIHTANILDLSTDLPIKVEWVDLAEVVERLLPEVRKMMNDGMITREEVLVLQYTPGRPADPLAQPVHNIMRTVVVSVQPDTPVAQIVSLLLQRGYRSLPVVTHKQLVGIITDGDLLRRAELTTRLDLQTELAATQIQHQLAELQAQTKRADDIMTKPVITVTASDPVRLAVERMAEHHLKRLPVVDAAGHLVGLVSRFDVLRAVEAHPNASVTETAASAEMPRSGATVTDLMYTDVPTVQPTARLEEIIQALEANRRRRAVVVDNERHVLGIITDGDLLRRSHQATNPGLLNRLRNLITGQGVGTASLASSRETAAELMTAPAITIGAETTLNTALHLMLQHGIKRLPVVDADGHLIGLLGRASLLNGLLKMTGNHDASQPA